MGATLWAGLSPRSRRPPGDLSLRMVRAGHRPGGDFSGRGTSLCRRPDALDADHRRLGLIGSIQVHLGEQPPVAIAIGVIEYLHHFPAPAVGVNLAQDRKSVV